MFDLHLWLQALMVLLAMGVATWLLSIPLRNVSIVDSVWSLLIAAAGGSYFLGATGVAPRALLVMLAVVAWAARLAIYITVRNWGHGEDRRYQEIRARNQPNFAVKSLYLVFAFQALLAWLVSLPLLAAINSPRPIGWLDYAGAALWLLGFLWESFGDWQLAHFKADAANRGKVMDRGLWRYSRHPNYFGEACLWWGFFLVALGAGGWWAIVSPLVMTTLLLKVSGVSLLEKDIGERRPGYRDYIARTNAFLPWIPRVSAIAFTFLLGSCAAMNSTPMPTVASVDLPRFMGPWHVIANIPTFIEKGAHNAVESYRLLPDGTIETTFTFNKGSFDGPLKRHTPHGFVLDKTTNARWGMRFIWPIKADYRIIYLNADYTQTVIGRQSRDYVWIMARTPSISDSDYSALLAFVGKQGYDVSKVQKVPQQ